MLLLILKRLLWMIPTLFVVSMLVFTIIQLPPGDYLTSYIAALEQTGDSVSAEQAQALKVRFGVDEPMPVQYLHWVFGRQDAKTHKWSGGLVRGDLGMSFEWNKPVWKLIQERILVSLAIALTTLVLTWALAVPLGIYAAVKQYSPGDYALTFLGFLGLATPNFLLALVCMYLGYVWFGVTPGGIFSPAYQTAPWSWARFADLLAHIWVPVVIVGVGNTAGLMRVLRGNLLDELRKQYVLTARARGLARVPLLLKYPVRVALIPLVSTIGWVLPAIISGSTITEVVLGLPTTGPLLLQALMNQDMYLAGGMLMLMSALTVVGTLVSDILLILLDPRIKLGSGEAA
jgi:peptide/nickel transport system permease protein